MSVPPEDLNDILRLRREKLEKLRAAGVNPYPYRFEKTHAIPDLLKDFDSKLETEEHVGTSFAIAGRIHTIRVMGKKKVRFTKAGTLAGSKPNYKKAIVTLAQGEVIDFYSNV